MLHQGDILDKKYRIDDLIGEGGMSRVWKAKDLDLNMVWAVKEIDKRSEKYKAIVLPDGRIPEFETMKRINHPAFPRIIHMIEEPSYLYIIMDYIEGENLLNIIDYYGVPNQDDVVNWMIDACDAIDYLHHLDPPVMHRDIKPSNMMVDKQGRLKIIDFGTAKEYEEGERDRKAVGTKAYAAPEQFQKKTDLRSDVYTLGVTLYQLLTGEDPHRKGFVMKPIRDVNPSLSSGLEKIVLRATEADPDDRYQTMEDMADALSSYRKLDDEYLQKLRKKIRSFRLAISLSALLLVLSAGLITAGVAINNRTYEALLGSETLDRDERAMELEQAITLKPKEEAPYIELVKLYAEDGKLTESEAGAIRKIYGKNKDLLKNDVVAFADINYTIGEALLQYYTGESDHSARAKLLSAYPYFENATVDGFDRKPLAEGYAFMGRYYKDFVIADTSLVTNKVEIEDYRNLLAECENTILTLNDYSGDPSGKMRVITYSIILSLLDNQRSSMAKGGIREEEILSVTDKIEKGLDTIDSGEPAIVELKQEAEEDLARLKDRITSTYENLEKDA